jgi:site-specific recombinase XerD
MNSDSPEPWGLENINTFQKDLAVELDENWPKFFWSWREEEREGFKALYGQNILLNKQNLELRSQLSELVERDRERAKREEAEDLRRASRARAKKLPLRAFITPEEFVGIQEITRATFLNPVVRSRTLIALTLLYLTGLRVSNLLLITKRDMVELVEKGETTIPLIKRGPQRHTICIGSAGRRALRDLEVEIKMLLEGQPNSNGPLLFSQTDPEKALDKYNLNKQCNKVCVKASCRFDKYIRTHSFRASLITSILDKEVPIEKARDLIGHSDISTTAAYRRSRLTLHEMRSIVSSIQSARICTKKDCFSQ